MQRVFCLVLLATIACSCSPVSKKKLNKTFRDTEAAYKDHTGFMLYDLDKDKIIYEFSREVKIVPCCVTWDCFQQYRFIFCASRR